MRKILESCPRSFCVHFLFFPFCVLGPLSEVEFSTRLPFKGLPSRVLDETPDLPQSVLLSSEVCYLPFYFFDVFSPTFQSNKTTVILCVSYF